MFKKEIRYFFSALMFFTRIPCPTWPDFNEEYLNKSRKYFPMIGWIVGGIAAGIIFAGNFIFPLTVCVILSMISSVIITGAFHEDGFADVCDGFGGGWTKEKILTIMKDSRVGAFGAIGIILLLGLKFIVLYEIGLRDKLILIFALINAHTTSRFVASTFVQSHEYVQDLEISKSKPLARTKLSISEILFSFIITLIPFVVFQNYIFLITLPVSYLPKLYLGHFFKKHIGGYTGDCLGATQQVSEIFFYLTVLILLRWV
jgi:adenosylcobinamide-GDP ribazoletransferase